MAAVVWKTLVKCFLLYPGTSLAVLKSFYMLQAQVKSLNAFIILDAVISHLQVHMRKTEILKFETHVVHASMPLKTKSYYP